MCGIVGYIGSKDALSLIMSGLSRLEYRGYDSAGVAIQNNGRVRVCRAVGKLCELKKALELEKEPLSGSLGLGHTRWATHGRPSQTNAHPHTAGRVSLIHNGIIENYMELRDELLKEGRVFSSETDTEIAAHLLDKYLNQGLEPFAALKETCRRVRGSFAFLAIDAKNPDRILVAKKATPIVIGVGEGENIVASDIPAILDLTRKVIFLEDGDIAEVTRSSVRIEDGNYKAVSRQVNNITWDAVTAQKGGYKHYMLKEIHEQMQAVADTLRERTERVNGKISIPEVAFSEKEAQEIRRVIFVACGTAWHACLVGKFYFETLANIPCEVDYASEFRYRNLVLDKNTLVIAVSQSGETADTLAAIDVLAGKVRTFALCNVLGSSLTRKVQQVLFTRAGPEISVASTKAFTTQLVSLYLLALYLGQQRGAIDALRMDQCLAALLYLPSAIDKAAKAAKQVSKVAKKYHRAKDFLYLGRGICYPIALEGALKLKELSYIHAEGYPAGEMKHGPIALIDEDMPVVVVLQKSDILFEKTLSNLREVESRGGRIIALTDIAQHPEIRRVSQDVIEVPFVSELLSPVVLTIPLQLLAYYIADFNGSDVDLPRNLAKSVTVE